MAGMCPTVVRELTILRPAKISKPRICALLAAQYRILLLWVNLIWPCLSLDSRHMTLYRAMPWVTLAEQAVTWLSCTAPEWRSFLRAERGPSIGFSNLESPLRDKTPDRTSFWPADLLPSRTQLKFACLGRLSELYFLSAEKNRDEQSAKYLQSACCVPRPSSGPSPSSLSLFSLSSYLLSSFSSSPPHLLPRNICARHLRPRRRRPCRLFPLLLWLSSSRFARS